MKFLIVCSTFLLMNFALADSPLTATAFFKAYEDEEIIIHVKESGLDEITLKFLGNKKKDPVLKIAVINALSWGKSLYVQDFERYLLKNRRGLEPTAFDLLRSTSVDNSKKGDMDVMSADDLMCWAYLQALHDYSAPKKALYAAELAIEKAPKSMAHAVVYTLIKCQLLFEDNWCDIYQIADKNIVNTTYADNNLNEEALKIIMDYLNMYKSYCK